MLKETKITVWDIVMFEDHAFNCIMTTRNEKWTSRDKDDSIG